MGPRAGWGPPPEVDTHLPSQDFLYKKSSKHTTQKARFFINKIIQLKKIKFSCIFLYKESYKHTTQKGRFVVVTKIKKVDGGAYFCQIFCQSQKLWNFSAESWQLSYFRLFTIHFWSAIYDHEQPGARTTLASQRSISKADCLIAKVDGPG